MRRDDVASTLIWRHVGTLGQIILRIFSHWWVCVLVAIFIDCDSWFAQELQESGCFYRQAGPLCVSTWPYAHFHVSLLRLVWKRTSTYFANILCANCRNNTRNCEGTDRQVLPVCNCQLVWFPCAGLHVSLLKEIEMIHSFKPPV